MTGTTETKRPSWRATVTSGEHSTVLIEGEIPYAALAAYRAPALAALGKNVSLDGFRKGHIPEKVLLAQVGEMALLTEMAERALAKVYPEIITEHRLDVIGHPHITLTKLAPKNPLGFSARVAVVPEVTLPEHKTIAGKIQKESAKVSEEELKKAIDDVRRQKVAYERMQAKAAAKKQADESGLTLPTPETVTSEDQEKEVPLPELTDEYVKTLGEFTSVEDFKTKFRAHLEAEKAHEVHAKHRAAITDRIIDMSTIDLPQVLIDSEINQMFGQMEQDLTRANLSITDYLGHIQKTKEELAAEWKPAAEKRAKLQLVLNKIAEVEHITVSDERVDQEVARVLAQHKDADPARVRIYISSMLTNEAVLTMLEKESEQK